MTRNVLISGFLAASLLTTGAAFAQDSPTSSAVVASGGLSAAQAAKAEAFIKTKHNKVRAVLR